MAAITADGRQELVALYLTMFGAAPSTVKLAEMVQAREAGKTLVEVATTQSSDTAFALVASKDAVSFADYLVNALLASDTPAVARDWATNWVVTMVQGTKTKPQVIAEAVIAIRATDNPNYTSSKAELTTDVTAALNTIDNPVQSFTLTTGADTTMTGGSGADTFVAAVGSAGTIANGTTLTAGDNLKGGGGTDTLSIAVSGTSGAALTISAVSLSSVEKVEVSNFDVDTDQNNTHTFDMSQATGITNISLTGSSANGDTLFTNVAAIAAASMANGSADLTIGYVSAATLGTADVQTLALSGQTAGSFKADGVETVSITSSGSANTLTTLAGSAIATLNVSGDKNLTVTDATTNTLKTVDASTFTGALTLTTDDTTDMKITGGTGNDSFKLGATFTSADTINGGDGTSDTLTTSNAVTSTTLTNVTNVENLTVTGGAAVTLSKDSSISKVTVSDATASVVTLDTGLTTAMTVALGQGDKVANTANVALTVTASSDDLEAADVTTITGGTGTDTVKVTASSSTVSFASLITAVENVTVVDNGDAASGLFVAGEDITLDLGAYGTALTIDGSALDAGTFTGFTRNADWEDLTVTGTSATKALNITGGAGYDTITGGTANDVISSGAGNDSINGSAGGDDSINAGAGNDTINMGAALTAADTIDGGDGTDTLSVTSLSASGLTNVTNIETLSLSGASSTATLTANLSFTTIDMSSVDDLAQTLTLSTGYTNATTASIDAGDKVVNSANVALTVTATAANLVAASATTITGGTGTDTLKVTADSTTANIVATSGLITGVDVITVVDGGDATTGTVTAGRDITIDLASYAAATTALTIDASEMDSGTVVSGVLTNDEVLTITGTSARALSVTGGGGGDTIVGSSHATIGDVLNGGAGNDTFTMAANLSYLDTITGGDGTDTLTTDALTDINLMNVTGIETLTLSSTATLSSYFDKTGIKTVNVSGANAVDASGTQSAVTYANSAVAITNIKGGLGNDTFSFATAATLTTDDTIDGGAGTDTITVSNSTGGVTGTIDFDDVVKVEIVKLGTASGAAATTAEVFDLTIDALAATTAQTIIIDASVITDTNDTVKITNSANTTTTKFDITGGAGIDTLTGSNAADTINGGGGNDIITGGLGADSLTGGAGSDKFEYSVIGNFVTVPSGNLAADVVSDFTSGADILNVALDLTGGKSQTNYNATYVGTAASNGDALSLLSSRAGEYFFNTTTKQFIMDVNGDGLIQANDLYVGLTGLSALTTGNVVVTVSGLDFTGSLNVVGGDGNDTYTMTTAEFTSADTINGGAGTDTIAISDAGGAVDADYTNLKSMERLTLTGASTAVLASLAAAAGVNTVVTGNAATTVTASSITTLTVTATAIAGNADLTLDGAGATNHVVTTGVATGNIAGVAGTGTLHVTSADLTDDTASITTTGSGNITVVGGGASDTITVGTLATAGQTFTGTVAKFNVTGGANGQIITTGVAADTVDGGAGTDTITTGDGADSITGGTEADTITAGIGDDTLVYLLTADLFTGSALVDSIVGGDGTDNLKVGTNTVAFDIANTDVWSRAQTVEKITAVANNAAITIALDVTAEAAGIRTVDISLGSATGNTINASEYVTATTALTLTGGSGKTSITGGSGNDTITGGAAGDSLVGGDGIDSIVGAAGGDTILGGNGNDIINGGVSTGAGDSITGGAGSDTVVFSTRAEAIGSMAGTDTANRLMDFITDHVIGTDKIQLGIGANAFGTALTFTSGTTITIDGTYTNNADRADLAALATAAAAAITEVASSNSAMHAFIVITGAEITTATGFASRTFLVINDDTTALAATDTWIDITGVSGTVANVASDIIFG